MKKTIDELRDIATRKTSEGTSTAGPYATLEEWLQASALFW